MQDKAIQSFSEKFFTNLRCTLSWQGHVLVISNIPKDFEDFSGKQQPYRLVFDDEHKDSESELMVKGSYLLKVMMNYLDTRGQTTLMKIVFEMDPKDAFLNAFSLKNGVVSTITRKQEYKHFLRFTFLTTLQYLNEREQLTNEVYVHNGEIVQFDKKFDSIEGRKEDLKIKSVAPEYEKAKEHVKTLISEPMSKARADLQQQLEKEIERIKAHYGAHIAEHEAAKTKVRHQIVQLENELKKNQDTAIETRLGRAKDLLETLERSDAIEKLRKEEEFFISDEIHKRSLSVATKLINTTIFYYPAYTLTPFLKSADSGRIIEVSFDPVKDQWSTLPCEACANPLKTITLCLSGHLTCENCVRTCQDCKKQACKKCLDKTCTRCKKLTCKHCSLKCGLCNSSFCKEHVKKLGDGSVLCVGCVEYCTSCRQPSNPKKMISSNGKKVCEACYRKERDKATLARVFDR